MSTDHILMVASRVWPVETEVFEGPDQVPSIGRTEGWHQAVELISREMPSTVGSGRFFDRLRIIHPFSTSESSSRQPSRVSPVDHTRRNQGSPHRKTHHLRRSHNEPYASQPARIRLASLKNPLCRSRHGRDYIVYLPANRSRSESSLLGLRTRRARCLYFRFRHA